MIVLTAVVLPLVAIGLHYEALMLAARLVRRLAGPRRGEVLLAMVLALVAHIVEVTVFAIGWLVLIRTGAVELSLPNPTLLDTFYFSGSVFTSLGFGDIVPQRGGQLLTVLEVITGLVLIAWTASFAVFVFQLHERSRHDPDADGRP